jgi:hypothetical protein
MVVVGLVFGFVVGFVVGFVFEAMLHVDPAFTVIDTEPLQEP